MKILVVLACVAMVTARPEAPLQGYNYAAPRPAAFPVSSQAHSQSFAVSGGFQAAAAPAYQPAPAPAFQPAPAYHAPPAQAYQPGPSFGSSGFGSAISSSGAHAQSFGFGSSGPSTGFGSAVSSGGAHAQSFAPQQTVVQKHIYVHVPPQEPEEVRGPQFIPQSAPRKHYKIIFIKTPNVQPSAAQIALQQAQQEEKTIVYVLVKKPEDQQELSIPQLAPLPPSKPEVYFIKYKANRGAQQGHGAIGVSSGGSGFASQLGSAAVSSGAASSVSSSGSK
ncbi:uncharacterized protein LOC128732407 [Sabethes cyaneus]|uniref:uncharacterized protein LOC128732407 n=1 Tax=Sabethes cyaneus TaxID=53552 RepID=UPI00237DFD63|nr:uncharacterized protein LOC128732407 [Sabethes cyaneus]